MNESINKTEIELPSNKNILKVNPIPPQTKTHTSSLQPSCANVLIRYRSVKCPPTLTCRRQPLARQAIVRRHFGAHWINILIETGIQIIIQRLKDIFTCHPCPKKQNTNRKNKSILWQGYWKSNKLNVSFTIRCNVLIL